MKLGSDIRRTRLFSFLTVVVVLWFAGLTIQGWSLHSTTVPMGIVCLSMPQTAERAQEILDTWKGELRDTAHRQIWLDYPFLLLYPLWFFLALKMLTQRLPPGPWAVAGGVLAWAMLPVMALDLYENGQMQQLLDHPVSETNIRALTVSARLKFALIAAALLWLLVSWVRIRSTRQNR